MAIMAVIGNGVEGLAIALGTDKTTLSGALLGRVKMPDDALLALACISGVPIDTLRGGISSYSTRTILSARRSLLATLCERLVGGNVLNMARASGIAKGGLPTSKVIDEATQSLSFSSGADPKHIAARIRELLDENDPRAIAAVKILGEPLGLSPEECVSIATISGVQHPVLLAAASEPFVIGRVSGDAPKVKRERSPSVTAVNGHGGADALADDPAETRHGHPETLAEAIDGIHSNDAGQEGIMALIGSMRWDYALPWPPGPGVAAVMEFANRHKPEAFNQVTADVAEGQRVAEGDTVVPAISMLVGGDPFKNGLGIVGWTVNGGPSELLEIPLNGDKRYPFGARLKAALTSLIAGGKAGMPDLAERLSKVAGRRITRSAIDSWISGRYSPSPENMMALRSFLILPFGVIDDGPPSIEDESGNDPNGRRKPRRSVRE
jgi:transcriptional regulator with XRE-family HTH domain